MLVVGGPEPRELEHQETDIRPDRFFARTYLTKNLSTLASEVIRRRLFEWGEGLVRLHTLHPLLDAR